MDKRKLLSSPCEVIEQQSSTESSIFKKLKLSPSKSKIIDSENSENIINLLNQSAEEETYDFNDLCFDEDEEYCTQLLSKISPVHELDLSTFKRCAVISVDLKERFEKVLQVQEKISGLSAIVTLKGAWSETDVFVDDIVSVEGVLNESDKNFQINAENGYIVTSPDFLVSGTSVVGSLFCARKAVLSERFKGLGSDNMIMNIGTIVHEILQTVLKRKVTSIDEITKIFNDMLKSPNIVHMLYACKTTEDEIKKEIGPFLSKINSFVQRYVVGDFTGSLKDASNAQQKPYDGKIAVIQDIEENVWCPNLGLKGKIDVSVKVHPRNNFFTSFQKLMPLEIKTGRASFSLEHKGQLILYQMMMQDLGKQVNSGLLLYIRDGLMSEVSATRAEKRGLITMRNRLAYFLNKDLLNADLKPQLPEPISHHSACSRCPYNTICCAFLKNESNHKLSSSNPLKQIQEKTLSHLTDEHFDYFLHWTNLITLEHNELQKNIKLKHIWTKTPEQRFKKGTALINLVVYDLVVERDEEFHHSFSSPNAEQDFTASCFNVGDYLIVSTNSRRSVAAGRVINVLPSTISLVLPRDLNVHYPKHAFHLDKYESQSQTVFNFTNIGVLLDDTEESGRLRRIIIEKQSPTFSTSLPNVVAQQGKEILKQLNPVQRKAVLDALLCEDYMLIKGLPGTGKTQTLVALIQLLMMMKKSILITSHTNSAVDNILLRLKDRKIKFMRLGSVSRINTELTEFSETVLVSKCKSPEELTAVYNEYQIIAVTCLGSGHALLAQRSFDYCLVDEATQIYQPTVIRPLFSANRFILVGDPDQLAPLVKSKDAKVLGADESLFQRLDSPAATRILGLQYRMNRTITALANKLTYKNELICADDTIGKATMQVLNANILHKRITTEKWLARTMSQYLDQSCSVINTGDIYEKAISFAGSLNQKDENRKSILYINYCEIAIVMWIVDILIDSGVTGEAIGVIAPYRAQVDGLRSVFHKYAEQKSTNNPHLKGKLGVEVNTVDQYQGRDKKIIIYSCTQSESAEQTRTSDVEILDDRRRLTVAITRAKHKLIMIGDVKCLDKYSPFRDLFNSMSSTSKVTVEDNKLGFSWTALLNNLKDILN